VGVDAEDAVGVGGVDGYLLGAVGQSDVAQVPSAVRGVVEGQSERHVRGEGERDAGLRSAGNFGVGRKVDDADDAIGLVNGETSGDNEAQNDGSVRSGRHVEGVGHGIRRKRRWDCRW